MIATALWHQSTKQSILKKEQLLSPSDKEVVLLASYTLISNGTEKLVAKGLIPQSLSTQMRVPFMGGDFSLPIKYGYSMVGQIEGKAGADFPYYHVMHPHQDRMVIPHTSLYQIPKTVPPKRAVLASNLETAVTAIWDGEVSIGDRVLVVGFGLIGSLVARLLSLLPAVQVFIAEQNDYRQQVAKQMGFNKMGEEQGFDIAFNTSANATGLQTCIDRVGKEGMVVELSWFGSQPSSIQLGGSFHYDRKQIISSQVSQIPTEKSNRWDYLRRKQVVFELLQYSFFDQHLTHEIPFAKSPLFFKDLRENVLENGLSWVITY